MKIKSLSKLQYQDSYCMYKEVSRLKYPCHHVRLKGPRVGNISNYNDFIGWISEVNDDWRKQCSISFPKAYWSFSTSETADKQNFVLHYWFEDKNDALMFKLISTDYA